MAKVNWSGTHTGAGGFFPGKEPTGRRVSYSGIVVFEQDTARQEQDGIDGLHLATAYGDLTRFKKQVGRRAASCRGSIGRTLTLVPPPLDGRRARRRR
jgi:hypothetical protein